MMDFKIKSIRLVLPIVVGCMVIFASAQVQTRKFLTIIDEIDNHLTKEVKNTNDPSTNLTELKIWYLTECRYTSRKCDLLKVLIRLPEMLSNLTMCGDDGVRLIASPDSYLESVTTNYPYRRIQRVIDRFAFDWAEMCLELMEKRPKLLGAFKEEAYDVINRHLVALIGSYDIDQNVAKANEYLRTLVSDQEQEGVVTDALRQLIAMKSVIDEKMCNRQGFEIVLKNDLATGGSAHTNKIEAVRTIDHLVHHYSFKYAEMCLPLYKRKFLTLMEELDDTVHCNVLALVGVQLFPKGNDTSLGAAIRSYKMVPKFSNNSIEETEFIINDDSMNRLANLRDLNSSIIHRSISISAHNDSNISYLGRVPDLYSGEFYVSHLEVRKLFDKYLKTPCRVFIDTFGKEVFKPAIHAQRIYPDQKQNVSSELKTDLNYRLATAAYKSCRLVVDNPEKLITDLVASYPPLPGKSSMWLQ